MGAKYYYYPVTSTARPKTTRGTYDRDYERVSPSRNLDVRPETPSLSRTSSLSSTGPRTPTFRSVSPDDPKTRRRNVAFASPVAETSRRPREDELLVMRRFASHAHHCHPCEEALKSYSQNKNLCDRGFNYAKDLGRYFYCSDGKPFSEMDKKVGRGRIQVEVPGEYEHVKHLFYALDNGLNLGRRPKSGRPEIHQHFKDQSPPRSTEQYRKVEATIPTRYDTRIFDNELYEVRPARTGSRRLQEPVYQKRGDTFYETWTPYDDLYTDIRQTPIIAPVRTLPTSNSGEYYTSRSKDDSYYDRRHDDPYLAHHPRGSKRYSFHRDGTVSKRPASTYMMPYLSGLWK